MTRDGSVKGRIYIHRDRMGIKSTILNDYFGENPRWSNQYFYQRYRITRDLFKYILYSVMEHNAYFQDKKKVLECGVFLDYRKY